MLATIGDRQRRRRPRAGSLLTTSLVSAVLCATAAFSLVAQPLDPPAWSVQIGAASLALPAYAGADEHRIRIVPLVAIEYRERLYLGESRTGLDVAAGAYMLRGPTFRWAVEIGPNQVRAYHDADALAGMEHRPTEAYVGTSAAYRLGLVEASANIVLGMQRRHDVKGTLGLATGLALAPRWLLGVATSASFGDRDNLAAAYGVTEDEAVRRHELLEAGDRRLRPGDDRAFAPRSGLQQVRTRASLGHPVSARVAVLAFGQATTLLGDAADSPLTRRRTVFACGAGIAYRVGGL